MLNKFCLVLAYSLLAFVPNAFATGLNKTSELCSDWKLLGSETCGSPIAIVEWFNIVSGKGQLVSIEDCTRLVFSFEAIQVKGFRTVQAGQAVYFIPDDKVADGLNRLSAKFVVPLPDKIEIPTYHCDEL